MRSQALFKSGWLHYLPVGLSILATLFGWGITARFVHNEVHEDFDHRVEETKTAIRTRMQVYEQVLRGDLATEKAAAGFLLSQNRGLIPCTSAPEWPLPHTEGGSRRKESIILVDTKRSAEIKRGLRPWSV